MEERIEREWKSLICPKGNERTSVMCEWDVVSKGGRIFKRVLRQVDCHHPKLAEFGGSDCDWACEKVIGKIGDAPKL